MKLNVIDDVVKNDLCIGCGVCVGVCPQNTLKIQDNKYGEYIPKETKKCSSTCGLCLEVCPFSSNENEKQLGAKIYGGVEGIEYLSETGYYIDSYVGYSNEFRQNGASGGLATWLLTKLLREGFVDYVVCPVPQKDPEKLFSFEILSDEKAVKTASGSVYYPVEMSAVIQKILQTPGRYAVTGLPCFIKALRLAAQKNKRLRERLVFTIGLVCGQTKSKHYTEYISSLAGKGNSRKIQSAYYRGKSADRPASNFYFKFANEEGKEYKIFWDEGVSEAWVNRWFTPNPCNYCDDIFAELADIVFMDAWLPEYSKDSKGTSLVIVRSPEILTYIDSATKKMEIDVEKVSIKEVIKSQAGVIDLKRKQLSYRLYLAEKNGQKVPEKRVRASNRIEILKKYDIKLKTKMQEKSKNQFLNCCQDNMIDRESFKAEMYPYLKRIKHMSFFGKIFFPIKSIKILHERWNKI